MEILVGGILMEYTSLSNGIKIPKIGFGPGGCGYSARYVSPKGLIGDFSYRVYNKLIKRPMQQYDYVNAVSSAIQNGFKLIDYSAAYGDGTLIGKAIKKSGIKRSDLILTTRVSNRAMFNNNVVEEIEGQLRGLNVDFLDILMFHWPVTGHYEDAWLKMLEMQQKGYCKVIGVANCHKHHLERLKEISGIYPSINQFEVHPLFTQKELIEYCKRKKIQVEAYTPIARFDDRLVRLPKLKEIAANHSKSILQVVLRWHIQNGVIPVVRTLNNNHQKENINIFDFELNQKEMEIIDGFNINARVRYDPDNCDFSIL